MPIVFSEIAVLVICKCVSHLGIRTFAKKFVTTEASIRSLFRNKIIVYHQPLMLFLGYAILPIMDIGNDFLNKPIEPVILTKRLLRIAYNMLLVYVLVQIYLLSSIDKVLPFNKTFTIFTKGCKIPKFPLISKRIEKYIKLSESHVCSINALVSSNSSHMWVNENSFADYNIFKGNDLYCCYKHFFAFNNISNVTYGSCKYFATTIKVEHQFVRVTCHYLDDEIYDNFFIFDIKDRFYDKNNNSYNILILGIESMSLMNFHRTMPKTSKYLQAHGAVEMLGYNKVGDNSFPNLFPVLTGKSFSYVKETCMRNFIMDTKKCTFIWDEFKKIGYNTILGADSISGLLGTYEKNLVNMPTDFYLQPFIDQTINLLKNKNYNFYMCFGNQYYYKVLLNYIYSISSTLKFAKSFGMFWEESVSHEDLTKPKIMDRDYLNLLKKLKSNKILDTTVLIFLSDHGMRWGPIVRTKQGRQEERLPLLSILLPKRFKHKYKQAYHNLRKNSNRLTTAFDFHETLLNLLDPSTLEDFYLNNKKRPLQKFQNLKSSLFLPISEHRTCESIGIDKHWCTCITGNQVKIKESTKQLAAEYVVDSINKLIKVYPQCYNLRLKNILRISHTKETQSQFLAVAVEVSPGNGIFDATLYQIQGKWTISGTVTRLNSHRHEKTCVEDDTAKLYCYCR